MDIHVEHVCKSSGPSLIKRRGHIESSAENLRVFGRCLKLLGSGVGSGFLRHIPLKIYHRQVAFANICVKTLTDGHALKYLRSPRSDKNGKKGFPTETPDRFWPF